MPDHPGPQRPSVSAVTGLLRSHRVLVVVGVLCVTVAVVLGVLTVLDLRGSDEPAPAAEPVRTERTEFRRAGVALAVPSDMEARRRGRTVRLTGTDPQLVVQVGAASPGRLVKAHRGVLRAVRRGYAKVRVIGRERGEVDGRASITTSGTAVNDARVPIRFLVVTVAGRPRAFSLVAYTERDAAPDRVLPRLNAIVEGFEVLPR